MVINNSRGPLNSGGIFRTDAPGNDLLIVLTYCALITERVVLSTYQQKPRPGFTLAAERESAHSHASPPPAVRGLRLHYSNRWQGPAAPAPGAPCLPDLQVRGRQGLPPRSDEEGAGSAGAGVLEWGVCTGK